VERVSFELVGRHDELAAVDAFLARGDLVCVLVGEAGIGKTTVWRTGLELARKRSYRVVAATTAAAEAQLAYAALRDLLEGLFDDVEDALPGPQRRALAVALLRAEPADLPAGQAAVAAGFLAALRVAAAAGPLLVAVDDIQWLDASSALVLAFAARRVRDDRIGFLFSKRTGHQVTTLALDRLGPGELSEIEIAPLSVGALHQLLINRLDVALSLPALRAVHAISGGNPLYALEIARALPDPSWTPKPADPPPVPSTLRSLVETRVASLPAHTRDALGVAAALHDPALDVVGAVVGPDVRAAVAPAVAEGVVAFDGERARFTHPLLAAAAYAALTPARRREVHASLAELLEDQEERARHLALAATGPDEGVAAALEEAARAAFARGAPHGAVELSDHARALTPTSESEGLRRRTLAQVGYCLRTGESARARGLVTELLVHAPSGPLRAEALAYMGWIEFYGVDWRSSAEFYKAALAEPGAGDLVRARSEVGLAGALLLLREDVHVAAEHARAAVLLSERVGHPELFAEALGLQAATEFLSGRGSFPRELMERALSLEPLVGSPSAFALLHINFALVLSWADEIEASLAMYESLRVRAAELGDETSLGWDLAGLSLVECLAGRLDDAVRHLDEAYEIVSLADQDSNRAVVLATRALVEAHLGHVEAARGAGEEAVRLAEEVGAGLAQRIARSALGLLALSEQRYAETHEHLEALLEETRAAGIREPGEFRFLADDVEALVGLGRRAEAEAALGFLEECADATGRTSALGAARRCRAHLAMANGEIAEALAAAEEAAALLAQVPLPFEHARSLLVLGEVNRRARRKRRAREAFESALLLFERLGAALWAERARDQIARIGGRAPAGRGLTPTELKVAELVAQGLRNREVAAALFVTPKTVEFHLRNVFRKLDVRSRAELARTFKA
jgi:DNA-binding CsgD family transcriptional regulator